MQMKKRLKGFTLTEMIVVLAIIGVLAAILAPTMSGYYTSSRVKDANSDARMVYNAAQKEMQKYINIDRMSDTPGLFAGTVVILVNENGAITTTEGVGLDSGLVTVVGTANEEVYTDLAESVNQVVSDGENLNWAICVENYVVKACMTADQMDANFIGRCSSVRADGVKPESTDRSASTFSTLMSTGTAMAAFADDFYGVDGY